MVKTRLDRKSLIAETKDWVAIARTLYRSSLTMAGGEDTGMGLGEVRKINTGFGASTKNIKADLDTLKKVIKKSGVTLKDARSVAEKLSKAGNLEWDKIREVNLSEKEKDAIIKIAYKYKMESWVHKLEFYRDDGEYTSDDVDRMQEKAMKYDIKHFSRNVREMIFQETN